MRTVTKSGLAIVLALALISSGCNAAQWINYGITALPVILQIVTSILQIADVAAVPEAKAKGAEAQVDLALALKLVNDFKAAKDPATQNKVLQDLNAVLIASNTDIAGILSALHIADPKKQAAITAAVGVALSSVLAFEALLPKPGVTAVKAVNPPSVGEIKRDYNRAIAPAYPGAVIK